jgi:hypothetical protein
MAKIAVDLDGTLIEKQWPELGDWLPGAQEAMRSLLAAGHTVYLYTARLSSFHPSGDKKDLAVLAEQYQQVRQLLDDAGLEAIDICAFDKPFWHLLIDDRAMRFAGRPGTWDKILPVVHARVGSTRSKH